MAIDNESTLRRFVGQGAEAQKAIDDLLTVPLADTPAARVAVALAGALLRLRDLAAELEAIPPEAWTARGVNPLGVAGIMVEMTGRSLQLAGLILRLKA